MENQKENLRHILLFYFRKGKNASQAHKKLCAVYGHEALKERQCQNWFTKFRSGDFSLKDEVAAVAEWYRYRTVACFVTGSSPVPLKTRRVGQRCTLNLSRAETSSRWCGVVVRRGGASSGVVHVT
ncbi:uncharacterized protein TNCV_1506201 [Trichonephila clavipes]|nr:uncharacterized protein TNCV_1506201 [Trichonephila clavipes]